MRKAALIIGGALIAFLGVEFTGEESNLSVIICFLGIGCFAAGLFIHNNKYSTKRTIIISAIALFLMIIAFIVGGAGHAPGFGVLVIVCLIVGTIIVNIKAEEKGEQKQAAVVRGIKNQQELDRIQEAYDFAKKKVTKGIGVYYVSDFDRLAAAQAMREIGSLVGNSVYQEQTKDPVMSAIRVGSFAGTAAGIAAASETARENAAINARNAANRQWGAQMKADYDSRADKVLRDTDSYPNYLYKHSKLEKQSGLLQFGTASFYYQHQTNSLKVSLPWQKKPKTICVDGGYKADVYDNNHNIIATAYFALPMGGTYVASQGVMTCIIPDVQYSDSYTLGDKWHGEMWKVDGRK